MFIRVLTGSQKELLPIAACFSKKFYLAGGTAIALQLGHRTSIDFDFFTSSGFRNGSIYKVLNDNGIDFSVLHEEADQLHLIANHVKLTFLEFPFKVPHPVKLEGYMTMPELTVLSALKAYALGRRSKWKDYVDLYFLLKHVLSITSLIEHAESIFGDRFNAKLFRQQLAWYEDIDYSEKVDYTGDEQPGQQEIKDFLTEQSLTGF
ncbi:MAG TPA: nucleotidyl transferase AbiEii/AbiGii toxin family protein [Bacteroidales bacterium]|nr:nucleotidyl transferase AbiEii/AbiGii toxin family protein [Bacteroidales bacterium]